jgi:hypothetical protein
MNNSLARILELRYQIREQEYSVRTLTPFAINEALDSISDRHNQVVFRQSKKGKIVLSYRKKYPVLQENTELSRLDELITASTQDLIHAKAKQLNEIDRQIEEHKQAIKELEEKRNNLLTNKRIIELKSKFIEVRENSVYIEPSLSVFLD